MIRITPARGVFLALTIAIVVLALLATSQLAAARRPDDRDGLADVRAATDRYHRLPAAESDGYSLLTDTAGTACIDNPGVGTMGVHYANGALVGAGAIDAGRPQVLVYEPMAGGNLHLVAVEYVVLQAAWNAAHSAPPTLFGQEFMLTPDGNRYGLPAFYSLHAWAWKPNPSGPFAMWNPRVDCR